jgi:imidazolonepropionase-like amidohydrolase
VLEKFICVFFDNFKPLIIGLTSNSIVDSGVVMQPNRSTYEANRDIVRAQGLPWHEKYTHKALWGDLIFEFNKRGGTVVYGTDDNYQWSTGGFGNIRELQLVLESGMHPLEVLQTATYNSAKTLLEPRLGLVKEGYIADLILVDGSPAHDFKYLYPFGAIRMDENRKMYRTKGIVHTIKDGVVTDNAEIMKEVARIVAESKKDAKGDIVTEPFKINK